MCEAITDDFKQYILPFQYGFTKGRSILTNLMEFTTNAVNVIESGEQLDLVYTDIINAFSSLLHSKLSKKLYGMGVPCTFVIAQLV